MHASHAPGAKENKLRCGACSKLVTKCKVLIKADYRCHTPVIPAHMRPRQEDQGFEASLGYIVSLRPV
jgi:hypothetical protein